jgi:hypothetical protein
LLILFCFYKKNWQDICMTQESQMHELRQKVSKFEEEIGNLKTKVKENEIDLGAQKEVIIITNIEFIALPGKTFCF